MFGGGRGLGKGLVKGSGISFRCLGLGASDVEFARSSFRFGYCDFEGLYGEWDLGSCVCTGPGQWV